MHWTHQGTRIIVLGHAAARIRSASRTSRQTVWWVCWCRPERQPMEKSNQFVALTLCLRSVRDHAPGQRILTREICHDALRCSRGSYRFPRPRHDTARLGPNGRQSPRAARQGGIPELVQPCGAGEFLRGVAMLHSFWYSATARRPSARCSRRTRRCAHRHLGHRLDPDGQSARRRRRRAEGCGAARRRRSTRAGRSARRPQRERDYIEAVAAYYEDFANRPERARQLIARQGIRGAGRALSRTTTRRRSSTRSTSPGRSRRPTRPIRPTCKAAAILEKQFAKHPDHPGVAHYLIHSYDAPPIAQQGLPAARRYAQIAPAAPHALHMPSHIFTRVGAWAESVATNRRSADVARRRQRAPTRRCTPWTTWCTPICSSARDDDARSA